jgi:hypothetical protein
MRLPRNATKPMSNLIVIWDGNHDRHRPASHSIGEGCERADVNDMSSLGALLFGIMVIIAICGHAIMSELKRIADALEKKDKPDD